MIYELRQYTVTTGRMEECQVLFQDVIDPLFREVGIRPVGYWQPRERDGQTFVYLLAFESADRRMSAHRVLWVASNRLAECQLL
jgi:hypothetical protein